jgi:hypothetical protein
MVVMVASALHSIAAGNMLPTFCVAPGGAIREITTICVDQTEFLVSKLKDRGTHQAFGVVTNAQDFMRLLQLELGTGCRGHSLFLTELPNAKLLKKKEDCPHPRCPPVHTGIDLPVASGVEAEPRARVGRSYGDDGVRSASGIPRPEDHPDMGVVVPRRAVARPSCGS